MRTGIIGGTILFDMNIDGEQQEIKTAYGAVMLFIKEDIAILQRHGLNKHTLPHEINHHANISALKEVGVEQIIGVYSVGSLKKSLKEGSTIIPYDFISPWNIPSFNREGKHITPQFNQELKGKLQRAAKEVGIPTREGVYIQTIGPRLETKAEVKMLSSFGDVVGMTLASEATLACELDIPFAALCSVDNYANGVSEKEPLEEQIRVNAKKNREKILTILQRIGVER